MHFGLLHWWEKARNSFWFIPLGMMLLAAWAAFAVTWIDNQIEIKDDGPFGWLLVNAETARSTLSLVAGALITLSGVVFSMTMVTLSLTASQFGSRLLRTVMSDLTTKLALGAFLAAALYSLVVMRFVPLNQDSPFVPDIAVFLAGILTFLSLVMMIVFVHHVGVSIQAQNVVAEVANDLDDAICRVFPEKMGDAGPRKHDYPQGNQPELGSRGEGSAPMLLATTEGYLQAIDLESFMTFAVENDLALELLYRPGDFVIQGTPLARVLNRSAKLTEADADKFTRGLNASILTGRSRTPRQDVCCAVNELVEVAVRALSPGVNDPFTAVACIDHMTAVLTRLLQRDMPSSFRYDDHQQLRVIVRPTEIPPVIETAFRQITHYGAGDFQVAVRIMEGLDQLREVCVRASDREAVCDQSRRLYRKAAELHPEPDDQKRLKSLFDQICEIPQAEA